MSNIEQLLFLIGESDTLYTHEHWVSNGMAIFKVDRRNLDSKGFERLITGIEEQIEKGKYIQANRLAILPASPHTFDHETLILTTETEAWRIEHRFGNEVLVFDTRYLNTAGIVYKDRAFETYQWLILSHPLWQEFTNNKILAVCKNGKLHFSLMPIHVHRNILKDVIKAIAEALGITEW